MKGRERKRKYMKERKRMVGYIRKGMETEGKDRIIKERIIMKEQKEYGRRRKDMKRKEQILKEKKRKGKERI